MSAPTATPVNSSTPATSETKSRGGAKPAWVIVTGDLVRTGGMDRANLALASYLAAAGHPVHAVSHRVDDALLQDPHVIFHRVPKPLNSYLIAGPLLNRAGRRVGAQVAAAGGRVVVNGGNCSFGDINWVHYVHAAYRPERPSGILRRLKTEFSYRTFLADERRSLSRARLVIANSNRTREALIERVGVAADRIHTVYLGVDADVFVPADDAERDAIRRRLGWPADRPTVVFTGGLGDRRKGFDTLFAAWERLCKTPGWDADLVVVGQGAELQTWQQRAADAGMAQRIRFLGFRRDVPDILRAADVLVAPTRYEAYGLGVQEALCCGIPAFVSSAAGVAERYPAELRALQLPDPDDAADLASRLLDWRANTTTYRAGALSFGEFLRRRSWNDTAADIVRLAGQM